MCIGKERPAVSSCDVTQAPCGRPGNGDGQVDNASNPSSRIWILFSNLLEYFFLFSMLLLSIISAERNAVNRLNFHELEQTLYERLKFKPQFIQRSTSFAFKMSISLCFNINTNFVKTN